MFELAIFFFTLWLISKLCLRSNRKERERKQECLLKEKRKELEATIRAKGWPNPLHASRDQIREFLNRETDKRNLTFYLDAAEGLDADQDIINLIITREDQARIERVDEIMKHRSNAR